MHGLIHVILKQFIVTTFGEEKWREILDGLNIKDDSDILELRHYDDSITFAGVTTTARTLGVSVDDALRAYGGYFVTFVSMGGHLRMLKSMGDDFHTFLNHINDLHHSLERQFRTANFPIFFVSDVVKNPEHQFQRGGKGSTAFTLSYCSARGDSVAALVEGILPELARQLHNQTACMVRLTRKESIAASKHISVHVDATWRVTVREGDDKEGSAGDILSSAEQRKIYGAGKYWHSVLTSIITGGARKKMNISKANEMRQETQQAHYVLDQQHTMSPQRKRLVKQLSVHNKVRVWL
jgi:hypothetical protein